MANHMFRQPMGTVCNLPDTVEINLQNCMFFSDKEYKWRMLRLKKQYNIRSSQEEVLKRTSFGSTTAEKTMPVPKQVKN